MNKIKDIIEKLKNEAHQGFYFPIRDGEYVWRDTLDDKGCIRSAEDISNIFPSQNAYISVGITKPQKISKSRIADLEEQGNILFKYHEKIDEMVKISLKDKKNFYPFSKFIKGILKFGLKEADYTLLRKLLLQHEAPLKIARSDILANDLITELQIASGGWSLMQRVAEPFNAFGTNIVKDFYQALSSLSPEKSNPKIYFVVHKGLSSYWDQFADFADIVNKTIQEGVAFTGGPDGLENKKDGLYYKTKNGEEVKIDIIYSLGDIRRYFNNDGRQILKAVLENKVKFQPAVNPILNNSQLCFSLLNNPLTSDWLKYEMGVQFHSKLEKIIIGYFLASENSFVELPLNNKNVLVPYKDIFKFLSSTTKDQLLVRYVLTNDLKKLSGGWGLVKLSKLRREVIEKAISDSFFQYKLLKDFGKSLPNNELIAVSRYHSSLQGQEIKVAKFEDGFKELTIKEPRISDSAFYVRLNGGVKLAGYYRQYADRQDTGIKVGGAKRSVGSFIL